MQIVFTSPSSGQQLSPDAVAATNTGQSTWGPLGRSSSHHLQDECLFPKLLRKLPASKHYRVPPAASLNFHTDHSISCSRYLDSPREISQELQLSQRAASRRSQPGAFCCPASSKVVGTSNEWSCVSSISLSSLQRLHLRWLGKKKKRQNQAKTQTNKKPSQTKIQKKPQRKKTKNSQNSPLSPDFNWWMFSLYLPLWSMLTSTPLIFLYSVEKLKVLFNSHIWFFTYM